MSMGSEIDLRRGGNLFPERRRSGNESSSENEAPQVQPRRGGSGRRARPSGLAGTALASAALALLLAYHSPSPATALIHSLPSRGHSSLSQARVVGAGGGGAAGETRCRVGCDRHRRRLGAATAGTWVRVATTSTRMVYGADENEGASIDPFDEGKMAAQGQHVINWCGWLLVWCRLSESW